MNSCSEVGRSGCSENDSDVRLHPGGDDLLLADEDAGNRSVYRPGRQEREAGGAGHVQSASTPLSLSRRRYSRRGFDRHATKSRPSPGSGSHCVVVRVPLSGAEQRQDEDGQKIYDRDWREEFSVCALCLYIFGSVVYSAGA
ncbi:hypothetical protein KSP40_PGU010175 [Platanthera guangdongensis]|uniref:Uncharacterized protein n=1 Tax=Platanthera guangdongensis TaxID=2320717 RepID=A0ABR2MMB7_9ASPA